MKKLIKEKTKTLIQPQHYSKKEITLCILLLAAITFAAFSSSLGNDFTNWDDDKYVTENSSIQKLDGEHLKQIFTSIVTKTYSPLTVLSFAIEYHFFQLTPLYYILDNIILHIAIVALIFLFALQLGLSTTAAFLGAFLFGIHPMHVESVVWITERKDTLYAFFYMLALCSYMTFLKTEKKRWFALSLLTGLLSMLAKAMALSLPLVLLLLDWFYGRKFSKKLLFEKIPYFLYIIPLMFVTYLEHARVPISDFIEGGMIWIWSFTFNFKKFFWPYWLCPIYNVPRPANFTNLEYNFAFIMIMVFIYLLIRFRKDRWFIFASFFYIFSVFFLVRMKQEIHASTVADRFMYLPSLGICLWLGKVFADRLLKSSQIRWKKYLFFFLLGSLFLTLSVKTYYQSLIWKDSTTLWDTVLKRSPTSTAYHNRGLLYKDAGDEEKALEFFQKTIDLLPTHHLATSDIGSIYMNRKQYDLALKMFDRVLELEPKYFKAYHNKSYIYLKLKKFDLALENCLKGIAINPKEEGIYANCSTSSFYLGNYPEAMEYAKKAQSLGYRFRQQYLNDLKDKLNSN